MSDELLAYVDRVNFNTRKFPPVTHVVETAPFTGERKIRICRCWQSRKFPYCDDTHKMLVEAGDNVGPYVAVIKGYSGSKSPAVVRDTVTSASVRATATIGSSKMIAFLRWSPVLVGVAGICGIAGYAVADLLLRYEASFGVKGAAYRWNSA